MAYGAGSPSRGLALGLGMHVGTVAANLSPEARRQNLPGQRGGSSIEGLAPGPGMHVGTVAADPSPRARRRFYKVALLTVFELS